MDRRADEASPRVAHEHPFGAPARTRSRWSMSLDPEVVHLGQALRELLRGTLTQTTGDHELLALPACEESARIVSIDSFFASR